MTPTSTHSSLPEKLAQPISEEDFFQNVPPGQVRLVMEVEAEFDDMSHYAHIDWKMKSLLLFCTSEECSGYRRFDPVGKLTLKKRGPYNLYVTVCCRNCKSSTKTYSIATEILQDAVVFYKYGEVPQFGPPNPPKLMSLMGGERDAYLKGRRCENQGLGIAAFAYYRRVVENQKTKIIGEILKVAEKLSADTDLIEDLKAAKQETRFSEAIDKVKHGLPQVLLINGHNPLKLLHSALSEGLHATSDEDCLQLATSIRVVLTELVERMATAVKEEAELTSAVQRLVQAAGKRS